MHPNIVSALPVADDFTRLEQAASDSATSNWTHRKDPSDAQAIAGNYAKGRVILHGLPIAIENVRNSTRSGTSEDGKQWSNRMAAHYGEFSGTTGADGDPVDVYIGPFPESRQAFIINQGWPDGGFDEHKVCLGFPSQTHAVDAYQFSFDREWKGLQSIHPLTVDQLKWWLANGNMRKPFSLDQLPFDGSPAMTPTQWDADAQPVTPIHRLMYELRANDRDNLLLDAVTMAEILEDPDISLVPTALLDALVVQVNRMTLKMNQLQRIMDGVESTVKTTSYTISDPVKLRGTLQVCVLFTLSDGQAISIWFHNPDTTPNKLLPTDELISWKWMLNKKDVTIVVAPERGYDLNPREVARRVMRLAARNSDKFQTANANAVQRAEAEAALDSEISALETELRDVQTKIEVAKQRRSDDADRLRTQNAAAEAAAFAAAERAITTPDGYRPVWSGGGNPELAAQWQDQLDSYFQKRIIDVRNALRADGWDGEQFSTLTKNGAVFTPKFEYAPGLAKNIVGVIYSVTGDGATAGGADGVRDTMEQTPAEIAAELDVFVKKPVTPEPDPVKPEDFGMLPDGWTQTGSGMATNPDPINGGIVDRNIVEGRWFVVFNDDAIPPQTDKTFDTRDQAFEFFAQQLAERDAAVTARQEAETAARNELRNQAITNARVLLGELRYEYDLTGKNPNALGSQPYADATNGLQKFSDLLNDVPEDIAAFTQATQEISAVVRSALAEAGKVMVQPEDERIAKVNAAYHFTNASDAFKEAVAWSIGQTDYSPFKTAMEMDQAARDGGASIKWDIAQAVLDAVAERSALLDSASLAAMPYLPEGSLLDFAGDVTAAIAQLEVALNVVATNEPINRAEGKIEQADLELANAEQFRAAINTLRAVPVLDGASEQDDPKKGSVCDGLEALPLKEDQDPDLDDLLDDLDVDNEWDEMPEADDAELELA